MEDRKFYVYALFRPNGTVCYIGKGHGARWSDHTKRTGNIHLERIIAKVGELPKIKVREDLTEAEAFETEIALIKAIGREVVGGPLVNLTDGGEGVAGLKHSEETKAKIALNKRIFYLNTDNKAKVSEATSKALLAPEVRAKISAAQKKRFEDPKELAKLSIASTGRVRSDEANRKTSAKLLGQKRSIESRAKMSSWQVGRKMSDEARLKMSIAAKLRSSTPEAREVLSQCGKLGAAKRWHLSETVDKE